VGGRQPSQSLTSTSTKKSGKVRAFFMGQVIQKTKGQANPKVVNELLSKKLG
jgi:Asp-tRNA(Asn)/Glu-tRNA(Gln) amidotransferase B subunit